MAKVLFFLITCGLYSPSFACNGVFDVKCNLQHEGFRADGITKGAQGIGQAIEKGVQDTGKAVEKAVQDAGKGITDGARPLIPVREFLRSENIPPPDIGGYGVVVLRTRPTDATRIRYAMVCQSFIASFPKSETSNVPISDQMITIWPVEDPLSDGAKKDDCSYVMEHYDLNAAELAIRDAHPQGAELDGEGPYLVGWSPSNTRGDPDKLVLVVDFSGDNSQASVDHKFLFWKNKIVQNPSLWRSGFSLEKIRLAVHDFADQYGQSMLSAISIIRGNK